MKIKKFRNITKIKSTWEHLYNSNPNVTPFQSYESNYLYYKVFRYNKNRFYCSPVFFLAEENSQIVIVPLIINNIKKIIYDFSSLSPIDYYDIITSPNVTHTFVKEVLESIFSIYSSYQIQFSHINENSLIYKSIGHLNNKKEICVKINFTSNEYECYYASLSKHMRQNLRTAYNRINKDNISYHLKKYDLTIGNPDKEIWYKCQKMYEDRCDMKNNPKFAKIRNLIHRIGNPVNHIITQITEHAIFILFFENEPVAFLAGFYNSSKEIFYVPRLSGNNKFLRYNTGIVMLNETIKLLLQEGIKVLDLTRGNEPYKYSMGGVEHYNISIDESCKNILLKLKE